MPQLEPLEGRSLLANIVDLGLTYSLSNAGIENVAGVNSTDEVAGTYSSRELEEAFYLDNNLNPHYIAPAASYDYSYANAINDNGQVVGYSSGGGGFSPPGEAFSYSQGTRTDLGWLGDSDASEAISVNASGQVVGSSNGDAFLWSEATGMQDLTTMGLASGLTPTGINSSGQIVGHKLTCCEANGIQSFLWNGPDDVVYLPTLGGTDTQAAAINDSGEVVGTSTTTTSPNAPVHAFLWSQGETSLQDLGTLTGFTD